MAEDYLLLMHMEWKFIAQLMSKQSEAKLKQIHLTWSISYSGGCWRWLTYIIDGLSTDLQVAIIWQGHKQRAVQQQVHHQRLADAV